jgi:predicted RNase H-like nuclease
MPRSKSVKVVGIDGCRDGWVAVKAGGGRFAALAWYADVSAAVEENPGATVFGIDIPLSFPFGETPRLAELAARQRLGRSAASLFLTPPREVLEAESYEEANLISRRSFDRGVSRQSYGLRRKILEAVRFMESSGEQRLFEVHPELSFRLLAESQGTEIEASKKTWNGAAERRALLERVGLAPPFEAVPGTAIALVDDVLDAAAAAWTAHRIATGAAVTFGDRPPGQRQESLDAIWT